MFVSTMNTIYNELINLIMRVRIVPNSFNAVKRESAFDGGVEEKGNISAMDDNMQGKSKMAQAQVKFKDAKIFG